MPSAADINSDDYYKVLGVEKGASDSEIAKAYKKLALKHHPDKNPDRKEQAEEEFKKITEAYEVLRSPEKRKVFDQVGKSGVNGGNPQSGEPDFSCASGGRATTMSREEADAVFRAFFGGGDPFASMFAGAGHDGSQFVFRGGTPGNGNSFNVFRSTSSAFDDMGFASTSPTGFSRMGERQRSRRASTRSRTAAKACVLPQGTTVVVQGLTKSMKHNGRLGHVVDWDAMKARYEVMFDVAMSDDEKDITSADRLWLKPQNLTQLCAMEVTGLASRPELNGKKGDIFNYDASKRRYMVLIPYPTLESMVGSTAAPGHAMSLQPANCILSPGTCVVMDGLSKLELNGRRARIISTDREAARYTVQCEDGKQVKIKYENALC